MALEHPLKAQVDAILCAQKLFCASCGLQPFDNLHPRVGPREPQLPVQRAVRTVAQSVPWPLGKLSTAWNRHIRRRVLTIFQAAHLPVFRSWRSLCPLAEKIQIRNLWIESGYVAGKVMKMLAPLAKRCFSVRHLGGRQAILRRFSMIDFSVVEGTSQLPALLVAFHFSSNLAVEPPNKPGQSEMILPDDFFI
eukprot:s1276_g15.t1